MQSVPANHFFLLPFLSDAFGTMADCSVLSASC